MGARRGLQLPFPPAQCLTEGGRVEATSLRKEPQCRCRIKTELRSQSRPTSLKSRRPESQERCRTSHCQRLRLPTCPLIPTANQRNHRLTSRVAPCETRTRPCKRVCRGLASQRTSVRPVREPPSGGFSLGLRSPRGSNDPPASLGWSGGRPGSVLGDLLYDLARCAVIALPRDIGLRNHSDKRFALDHGQPSNLLLGQKLEGTIEVLVWRDGGEIR
jgi:hypothetical protein